MRRLELHCKMLAEMSDSGDRSAEAMDRSDRSDRDGLLMQIAELVSDVRVLSEQIRELQASKDAHRRELERYQRRVRELEQAERRSSRVLEPGSTQRPMEDMLRQQLEELADVKDQLRTMK